MTDQSTKPTQGTLLLRLALATTLTLTVSSCHWIALVSQSTEGAQGNDDSVSPALSAYGRYVAFASSASNLVADDTNGWSDIFLRDNQSGTVTRVSVSSTGEQANRESEAPTVSANGRYVVYYSWASNLVTGDTNDTKDVFVYDAQTETTTRVSVSSAGAEGNSWSLWPSISANGRYVTFLSPASNLVTVNSNGYQDIFVHDRQTGITSKVSVNNAGDEANDDCWSPAISANGRYVAFATEASNLVAGDTNGTSDIFLHDRDTSTTTRVSVDSGGSELISDSRHPALSEDGRYIAFQSDRLVLPPEGYGWKYDIYVHDRESGITSLVNVDNEGSPTESGSPSRHPDLSADGRYVTFESSANDLVEEDTSFYSDIFVHDRQTGTTTRVSLDPTGIEANSHSYAAAISGDGRYVGFSTEASNLTTNDSNGYQDVVIRAVPIITIDHLIPDHLPIGATTSVTITGSGFLSDVAPWFNEGQLSNVVVVDESTITADFTIPANRASGAYTMGINLYGTGPGLFTGVAARCEDCVVLF